MKKMMKKMMKKRALITLMIAAMALGLCACGKQEEKVATTTNTAITTSEPVEKESSKQQQASDNKETTVKETQKEVTNSGKYYKLYKFVKGYEIGNTGSIRLDCNPDDGYVQFDLSEWLQPNTFFSTDYLPKDGEYFAATYDMGGGEPYREKIYLEYSDNKIVIYFYSEVANPDTGKYDLVRQEEGSEFVLEEDSRFAATSNEKGNTQPPEDKEHNETGKAIAYRPVDDEVEWGVTVQYDANGADVLCN